METLNKRTLSLPSHIFKITFILLATSFALLGCGNEDSGSSNSVTSNCYDCSSILSPLPIDTFNSESTYLNVWPVTMSAQLYVDGAYFTPGMSSSYNLYRGPVFVYGQMTVNGSQPMYDSAGYCVVRPGTYQLKTRYVGSINQGSNFEVQELVAGNMILRMRTSSATPSMLYRSATNGQVRWMGVLEIVSVDGRLCQNFYSSMK